MSNSSNKMSVFQLTILTAVNMMGSGIIMLPSKLAQVGALSIVSWLVTAVGSMCLAYVFAKCGMYAKKGGGMGGYAEYFRESRQLYGKLYLRRFTDFCKYCYRYFCRRLCARVPE